MARALCNSITMFANRRGYGAAAAAVTMARRAAVEQRPVKDAVGGAFEAMTSWVPDPVTGYYRPANRSVEIDAVELRELLLSHKSRD